MGGANGHVAFELARHHPDLKIIVEDLPTVEAKYESTCPSELKSRVTYRAHSFFDPQPVKGADVYYMRAILHDWPDSKAIEIVKRLVAAMEPNSRILLLESVTPEFDQVPTPLMHLLSCLDLEMMAMFNSKERTIKEWEDLMKSADDRLILEKTISPPGSHLSSLQFRLGK